MAIQCDVPAHCRNRMRPLPSAYRIQAVPNVDVRQQAQAIHPRRQVSREDLGIRTIAGIEAHGARTTSTMPTGEVGNDRPFSITSEKWMSTQYHIPLLNIIDDPRMGKRTDEVTEFQPGEPDPRLFKIPEGYIVREHTNGQPD